MRISTYFVFVLFVIIQTLRFGLKQKLTRFARSRILFSNPKTHWSMYNSYTTRKKYFYYYSIL
jgi:hypothetical protein